MSELLWRPKTKEEEWIQQARRSGAISVSELHQIYGKYGICEACEHYEDICVKRHKMRSIQLLDGPNEECHVRKGIRKGTICKDHKKADIIIGINLDSYFAV